MAHVFRSCAQRGFLFCAVNSDTAYLRNGVNSAIGSIKGWKPGETGDEAPL